MSVEIEIDGLTVKDAGHAQALLSQGFISAEEFDRILPKLASGNINLESLTEIQIKNSSKLNIETVKEWLGLRKKD